MDVQPPPVGAGGLPASRFHCRLDDQPNHLVPQYCLRTGFWEDLVDRPLFVNSRAHFAHAGGVPEQLNCEVSLLDSFALQDDLVWISQPGTDIPQPFWLGDDFARFLAGVAPGDRAPSTLPPEARRTLAMAHVLVPADFEEKQLQDKAAFTARLSREFGENGYVPIARMIHPFHIAALRRYYRHLIRKGALSLDDAQCPLRYVRHNESVARFFHQQLTPIVAALTGQAVKPSYVYLTSYQSGAKLEKHTDREQCQFTITLCLDYAPEPRCQTPWPIQVHTPCGKTTVCQAIGDSLLFRGRQLPHSRDQLPEGNSSTSLLFHYVPKDFDGPLE